MSPPPPHDATLSELAYEAWAGPRELEISPEKEAILMKIRDGEGTGFGLRLSHDLVVKITRALCIGRTHRARVVQARNDERELTMRLVDKQANIDVLNFRRERSQRLLDAGDALTVERVEALEILVQRIHRCRYDEQRIEKDLRNLKTYQEEDLEAWKTAWLSVDKILDEVWTKADLLHDDESSSDDDDDDDSNQGPGDNKAPTQSSEHRSGEHRGSRPTGGHPGQYRRSKEDDHPPDRVGQSEQLSREAAAEKQRAWRARMNKQDKDVEAARTEWAEYVKNFKEEFNKYENQLGPDAQSEPNIRDKFRRKIWMPKVLQLGQVMNERMKTRKEVAQDAARIAGCVTDLSEATEQIIDRDNAATLRHFRGARIGIDNWLDELTNDLKTGAIDEVSWPRDKDVYDAINVPAPTIEAEDSASRRAGRELLARLEKDEGLPDDQKDDDTEIRDARLLYGFGKFFRALLQPEIDPEQGVTGQEEQNTPDPDAERPSHPARSASQEHSDTSSSKRRHDEDANSKMSKTQKRAHGENASSQLRGTIGGQDGTQHEERSRGRRRELPWEMRPRAVPHSSQVEHSNTAKPPPKPRQQLKPSAKEIFAKYAQTEITGAE